RTTMKFVPVFVTVIICITLYIILYNTFNVNSMIPQEHHRVNDDFIENIAENLSKDQFQQLIRKFIQINCECETKDYKNANLLNNTLFLKYPKQNITTLNRLKARHPNLPVDFITKTPRCELMPDPM
ncbi:unnamed protein product, partial [Meganyctiphanes norvegica]